MRNMRKEYIKPVITSINVNYEDVILTSGKLDENGTLDWRTGVNGETWGE